MGTAMGGRTLNVAALLLGAVCFVLSFRATQAQSAPVFTESVYYRTRDENIGVNTLVVTVRAEDADGDAITYSIINTTSSNFIAGSRIFSLGASTGEIRTAAYLDREQADWFLIHISATDGTFTSYAQAYFLVRDLDDVRPVVRLLEPALAFHESELPVDIARTAKLEDGDTILYEIQQFSLTLRSYDGVSLHVGHVDVVDTGNVISVATVELLHVSGHPLRLVQCVIDSMSFRYLILQKYPCSN